MSTTEILNEACTALKSGEVVVIIGYERGTADPVRRPLICLTADEADRLVCDEHCTHNLAVYLNKKELFPAEGKIGIIATPLTQASIEQLLHEHQITPDRIRVWEIDNDYWGDPADMEMMQRIEAMSREERWKFWTETLNKCIKCYACRAACPLCYCTRCIVEQNKPQWIPVWAAVLPNVEWQINRVMHLAGRCTGCGSCHRACPLGLPIHLLNRKLIEDISQEFGQERPDKGTVLSTYSPADKEAFIQ